MNIKEKKELVEVVGEALEQVVLPKFQELQDHMDKKFEAVDKRFEAVDKRFESVDKKFKAIDNRFDSLDAGIGNVRYELSFVKERLTDLEAKVGRLEEMFQEDINVGFKDVESVKAELKKLEKRIRVLELSIK